MDSFTATLPILYPPCGGLTSYTFFCPTALQPLVLRYCQVSRPDRIRSRVFSTPQRFFSNPQLHGLIADQLHPWDNTAYEDFHSRGYVLFPEPLLPCCLSRFGRYFLLFKISHNSFHYISTQVQERNFPGYASSRHTSLPKQA